MDTPTRAEFVTGTEHALVAALIVTYNSASYISPLIEDLRSAAMECDLRVVVVDNRSSDATREIVRKHLDIVLVELNDNRGYAGGINAGLTVIGNCEHILFLNPDLRLGRSAIKRLTQAVVDDSVGAVVPRMLEPDGTLYCSLRREPSVAGALGDAVFGGRMKGRPRVFSETDHRLSSYVRPHDVDWSGGAALLVPSNIVAEVGPWNEDYFLYCEEIDYFRRIRATGRRIRFQPGATVQHWNGGSGTRPWQYTLHAINRVRYVERFHGRRYSLLFRSALIIGELLRARSPVHRLTLASLLYKRNWDDVLRSVRNS